MTPLTYGLCFFFGA